MPSAQANNLSGRDADIKKIQLVARAAEAISDGDLVDRMVHGSQQQWSLLPVHGMFSCVRPSYWCHGAGSFGGQGQPSSQAFPACVLSSLSDSSVD